MDMMKIDEERRVDDFLLKYKTEVPDQGFTRRVMRHLPQRRKGLAGNVITALAWTAFAVAFCLKGGLEMLQHVVIKGFMNVGYEMMYSFSWSAAAVVLLAFAGVVGYYGFYAED
jgi:hypothetical protein